MFRTTIHADETTDVDQVVIQLRAKGQRRGVPTGQLDILCESAKKILNELVTRGREMAAIGSKISASQTLKDETYEVTVAFAAGQKQSFLARLIKRIRGV